MIDSIKAFLGFCLVIGGLIWYSNREATEITEVGIHSDSSDSLFIYRAAVSPLGAVAAPSIWNKFSVGDLNEASDDDSWIISRVLDPEGVERKRRAKRSERLTRWGCRELAAGTPVRVVEQDKSLRRIRIDGEKKTWWVRDDEIYRIR